MLKRSSPTPALSLVGILCFLLLASLASAAPKDPGKAAPKDSGVAGGLVIDRHNDSIMVQLDGDEEPTKYLIDEGIDKRSIDALKTIFSVDRVNVKYKLDGDAHRLLAIEKVVGKPSGVVIGEVLKVYNDFWVSVKPKGGPIDGYALNGPADKVKAAADVLKSLKPGDVVAIKFSTDGERHRILQIEVKPARAKPEK